MKIIEVTWLDASENRGASLDEVLNKALTINTTIGWFAYKGKDKRGNRVLIVQQEVCNDTYGDDDFVCIPLSQVIDIKEIK